MEDEALRAYLDLWQFADRLIREGREVAPDEAEWLYCDQPGEVWDALIERGMVSRGRDDESRN